MEEEDGDEEEEEEDQEDGEEDENGEEGQHQEEEAQPRFEEVASEEVRNFAARGCRLWLLLRNPKEVETSHLRHFGTFTTHSTIPTI